MVHVNEGFCPHPPSNSDNKLYFDIHAELGIMMMKQRASVWVVKDEAGKAFVFTRGMLKSASAMFARRVRGEATGKEKFLKVFNSRAAIVIEFASALDGRLDTFPTFELTSWSSLKSYGKATSLRPMFGNKTEMLTEKFHTKSLPTGKRAKNCSKHHILNLHRRQDIWCSSIKYETFWFHWHHHFSSRREGIRGRLTWVASGSRSPKRAENYWVIRCVGNRWFMALVGSFLVCPNLLTFYPRHRWLPVWL